MIMIIFNNHKIERKFADLLRDDWQSLRERWAINKMSLDKIVLYWKIDQHYSMDSDLWKSIPPKFVFKIIHLFSKQHTGNNIGIIKNTALKELMVCCEQLHLVRNFKILAKFRLGLILWLRKILWLSQL